MSPTLAVPRERLGDDPDVGNLVDLLASAAEDAPDKEFLRFAEGSWTFSEIDAWSSQMAHHLIQIPRVKPGDRVAMMLGNTVHWPLMWLAVLKAGGVAVPVNYSYLAADLEFVLRDSGASVVVTTPDRIDLVRSVTDHDATGTPSIATLDVTTVDSTAQPKTRPPLPIDPGTLANLQYTSGTTGFPKACMLPHDYWTRAGWIACGAAGMTRADVALTAAPFSYIDAMWNTSMCLFARATLVVLLRFSASGFFEDVRRHGVTYFYVLGTMPALLHKQPPQPGDRDNQLRLVQCSAIPAALHAELEERWGAPWREAYGMTESGVDLVSFPEEVDLVGSGLIGKPVPSKSARVVDADGHDVPDGEIGELITSGKPVMLGYWNLPEATESTLRSGWLHTGDLVQRTPEGYVRLVGRLKDMVRRGGENISCAEVEEALTHDHDVVACAVVAVPDELFGEEIKAFIQLAEGVQESSETASRVVEHARGQLARFKVPRYLEFVPDFPKTPSERIAKAELKKRAAETPGETYDLAQVTPRRESPSTRGETTVDSVTGSRDGSTCLGVEITQETAVITIRRPERLNALDNKTRIALAQAIREHGAGDVVRGIILTGEGRAFSAGEDLREAASSYTDTNVLENVGSFHELTRAILETKVPVIAAVNGIAVGGASEVAYSCDARIGTPASEFLMPENRIGLSISNASSLLLRRLAGNQAHRIVLASPRIAAEEARRLGLLDEVVPHDELIQRAVDVVHEWTPPGGATAVHLALLRPTSEEVEAAMARENEAAEAVWASGAVTAGVERFWGTKDAVR